MASESADPALSPAALSFVISGKTWKIGDAIYSTGVGAIKKKEMVATFGSEYATARAEGVFMGKGAGHKYRVKWTNLKEELICDYGANHSLFQDPSKERPSKMPKIHGPQPLSQAQDISSSAVPNTDDLLELHPSSGEDSEREEAVPHDAGISPLQVGENVWRMDPELELQDPRFGLLIPNHRPRIKFPGHLRHGIAPSELDCFELFMHNDLIPHLLFHTNANIPNPKEHITEEEMRKWIGIMIAMTLTSIPKISDLWMEEDVGFIPAHRYGAKSGLSKGRFEFIRQHFATGAVGGGAKTFDAFRPIQDFFNETVADVFVPGQHGWHGKDEKRADGPPALTHMKGKPEPVSFMFKTMCCAETGIMVAIEL